MCLFRDLSLDQCGKHSAKIEKTWQCKCCCIYMYIHIYISIKIHSNCVIIHLPACFQRLWCTHALIKDAKSIGGWQGQKNEITVIVPIMDFQPTVASDNVDPWLWRLGCVLGMPLKIGFLVGHTHARARKHTYTHTVEIRGENDSCLIAVCQLLLQKSCSLPRA